MQGSPYRGRLALATDQIIEERLAVAGARYTSARRAVMAGLLEATGPLSAAELHAALRRRVPLSSLYRSLAVLEAAGVLAPHHSSRGLTRYEPAEWLSGHHHHLLCTVCGRVEDLEVSPADERRMAALVDSIATRRGFRPGGHTIEIEGRCGRCS